MSNSNLGWLFYKDYYTAVEDWTDPKASEKAISKKVDDLISIEISKQDPIILGNTHFKATTTYPGLLLGSGNAHELPSVEGQAILGFHFDYTSGLPVVQGSSIKGVLRSAFRHPEYIEELIGSDALASPEHIKALEAEIFENGDVFFDAQIISSGKILGDDYITPHKNTKKKKFENGELVPDELCDPNPLRFIKVLPNVTFVFDFELNDEVLNREQKSKLFQDILRDLGLGAKTNVGYGKFKHGIYQTDEEIMLERYQDAIELFDIEKLESFKSSYPDYDSDNIAKKIEEARSYHLKADARNAFEKLDKSNKRHIESYINKWQGIEYANEFVEQLRNGDVADDDTKDEFSLDNISKFNALVGYLKNRKLTEEQKDFVEECILDDAFEKLKRRKKFPFGVIGSDRCLGKDRANSIADKLKLK